MSCQSRYYSSTQTILDFKWHSRSPTASAQWVFKKNKYDLVWGGAYKSVATTDSVFSDTITTGNQFEYMFEKQYGPHGYSIYGYVLAGHRVPAVFNRGKILVIVDSANKAYLANDLRTLQNDLIGDGWRPVMKYFSSSTTVAQIKSYILTTYRADPNNVKSLLLIGDLAVPYSGDYKATGTYPPDGHTSGNSPGASHEGAWPADCYYGDVLTDSLWTDSYVTNSLGSRTANNNSPGDGKFDNDYVPYLVTLQVGRIDLSNMSNFTLTERELLSQYLKRDHDFRHKVFSVRERCLVDDIFGTSLSPEDLANNAYRNMAPLVGDTAVKALNYLTTLNSNDYLWSFGFGYGNYDYNSAIGNTSDFANSSQTVKSVFSGFFGSYFGDWDNSNNFLRAPLAAQGHVLNTFYSGRPHWFFHHMGMGETIGYSTMMTQNNYDTVSYDVLYPSIMAGIWNVHPALMGDPTIRMQPVEPARNFYIRQDSCYNRFRLRWQAPSDTAVHSFYIFRAKHIDSTFTLLGSTQNLTYVDNAPLTGNNVYMLRDLKLQTSFSGTYFNLGQGVFDTISTTEFRVPVANAGRDTAVCTNAYAQFGQKSNNPIQTVYSWSPAVNTSDTITVRITTSGNRILLATDTLTKCTIRDTAVATAWLNPVAETISKTSTNSCGDTTNWSSTLNNGNGYNYSWSFTGGSPSSQGGYMLNNPSVVYYYTTGNYLTSLLVTDTLRNCRNMDTASISISCVPLPIENVLFLCDKLSEQQTKLSFFNLGNTHFQSYEIYGVNSRGLEELLYIIKGSDFIPYEWIIANNYSEIRLIAVKADMSKEIADRCFSQIMKSDFTIFPVPTSNSLYLQYNGHFIRDFEYKIYNTLGQEFSLPVISENTEVLQLNTASLVPGHYVLLVFDGFKFVPIKFTKA
ncbi:MAG: hypothetical protein V4613_03505 [Bacteroidota bacterium]